MHNHYSQPFSDVESAPYKASRYRGPRLEIAIRSLRSPTGLGRYENQDNFLFIDNRGRARFLRDEQEIQWQVPNWPPGYRRLAVLDGMGGHSHGREAAEKAVDGLLQLPAATDLAQLSEGVNNLHRQLYQEFQSAGLETGCTLVLLEIPPRSPALLFHVGDSRLYAIDSRHVRCLTVDHVPATHLALLGMLDGAQWLQQVHAQSSSQISQAFILGSTLGATNFYTDIIEKELYELDDSNLPLFLQGLNDRRLLTLESDQVYLMASDGLWHLHDPQMFVQRWPTLLAQPHRSLEELLDELLDELAAMIQQQPRRPDDNCTVVLVRKPGRARKSSVSL